MTMPFSGILHRLKTDRSLLTQSMLWVIIPQFFILLAIAFLVYFVNQRAVVTLLIDRDRQLATISASRISQAMMDYATTLELLAEDYSRITGSTPVDEDAMETAIQNLRLEDSSITVFDANGIVFEKLPPDKSSSSLVLDVRQTLSPDEFILDPWFSDLYIDEATGSAVIFVAVPVVDSSTGRTGILFGGLDPSDLSVGLLVRNLKVGDEGFAYLVDSRGHVIYHPDSKNIGTDFSNRQVVSRVISGQSGGGVESSPAGEHLVVGYAPIEGTGWGLVVREPWEEVIDPVRMNSAAIILVILLMTALATFFLWQRMKQITTPIRQLEDQAASLGSGRGVEPVLTSGISEIDRLSAAFMHMAEQVDRYRARLHRHVRAVTHSQDEERRRVARELHDETLQNMLAIGRQLELLRDDHAEDQSTTITQIRDMVKETILGVRQTVRNLRPLILEDLGLIPAVESILASIAEEDPGLDTGLAISGHRRNLPADMELAVFRIVQEALSNCRQHSGARTVTIFLDFLEDEIRVRVQDDGRGFVPPRSVVEYADLGHFGLMGIQERVLALGGQVLIESESGNGTCLDVRFPITGGSAAVQ